MLYGKEDLAMYAYDLKAYYVVDRFGVKYYVRAVDGVDISFKKNEIIGIAGESGCGKSTLIKALYGAASYPLCIMNGKIIYNFSDKSIDILSLSEDELEKLWGRFISYIPQASMGSLNPTMRIKDHFIELLRYKLDSFDKDVAEESIRKYIDELGLPEEILTSYPHQLSGGMRQRVIIALATILQPRVVFADEPTTALDVIVQRGVIQLLRKIHSEQKNTLVVVTHDMGVHAEITNRMIIMYAGKIVEAGPTEKVFDNPLHPYTYFLINSLPQIGDKSRKSSLSGRPPSLINPPPGCRFHPRCPYSKAICREEEPILRDIKSDRLIACHNI